MPSRLQSPRRTEGWSSTTSTRVTLRPCLAITDTPFHERPSIDVTITNERGEVAGSLTVIEALQPNFHLTMHLRDAQPTERYDVEAVLFYGGGREERVVVDRRSGTIDITLPGDQTLWEEEE